MPFATGRITGAVLAALTATATLLGCAPGGTSSPVSAPTTRDQPTSQVSPSPSGLTSALDLVPDISNGWVTYTNWSMLGHRSGRSTAAFASSLTNFDTLMQRYLGLKSVDAQWEVDVNQLRRAPVVVLGFDEHTNLSALAARLTRLGYRANGEIFTGSARSGQLSEYGYVRNIAIDPVRHLVIDSYDVSAIRSVLAAPAHPFGRDSEVIGLLTVAGARLGRIATASTAVGSVACVKLTNLIRVPTPAIVADVRKMFHGIFTPPRAEITAMASGSTTTALDVLTFPDERTARVNRAGRAAAYKVTTRVMLGGSTGMRVTGSAVTGRVLSFNMTARQPDDFPQLVNYMGLGVDICP